MSDWIEHTGGECPVNTSSLVDIRTSDGSEHVNSRAYEWYWECEDGVRIFIVAWRLSGEYDSISDIVDNVIDNVNNPSHYTSHKSGIECIDVTRHMSFNLGNATKYIWRCDLKKDAIEDLRKAVFYLNDEIALRLKQKEETNGH